MEESYIWKLMSKSLTGESTPEEEQMLEEVLEANPRLKQTYVYLKRLNVSLESTLPLTEAELEERQRVAFEKLVPRLTMETEDGTYRKKHRRIKLVRWISIAAAVLVIGGLVTFFLRRSSENEQQADYVKEQTEKEDTFVASQVTSVVLEDGTKVWLNQGSVLKCDDHFNRKNRVVTLKGEAFFDVSKNAELPFVVRLKEGLSVKVLGTRFNVKAYPHSPIVETSLLSGKIALSIHENGSDAIMLEPKEKIRINIDSLQRAAREPTALKKVMHVRPMKENPVDHELSETAWMDNKLSFNDVPFGELGYELQRYYGKKIVFKDEHLKQYHLTGSFKGKSLQQILKALEITTPFHYKIAGEKVILYNKNNVSH